MAGKPFALDLGPERDEILMGAAGAHNLPNKTPEQAEEAMNRTLRRMLVDWAITYESNRAAQNMRSKLDKSAFPEGANDGRA